MGEQLRGAERRYEIPPNARDVQVVIASERLPGRIVDISPHGLGIDVAGDAPTPPRGTDLRIIFPHAAKEIGAMLMHGTPCPGGLRLGLFIHQPFDQEFVASLLKASS